VPADENAYFEVWLTIHGKTAVCGVRLSDRTMRHRTYKTEHIAASLRPTVAAAMVRLAAATPGMIVLDPMCGAGTILAEQKFLAEKRRAGDCILFGGDIDPQAIYCTKSNMDRLGPIGLARWDARQLPLADECVDRIISNPPFGKQLSSPEEVVALYQATAPEWDRVLRPGGRAVLLVAEQDALRNAVLPLGWQPSRQLRVRVLGQAAVLSVWNKPGALGSM
ncbi:MAG: TRM11 family SAM-dependent methyltransferase, partial [Gemmataceae bacterium]